MTSLYILTLCQSIALGLWRGPSGFTRNSRLMLCILRGTRHGCGCRAAAVTAHDICDGNASSKWIEIGLVPYREPGNNRIPETKLVSSSMGRNETQTIGLHRRLKTYILALWKVRVR